MNSNNPFDNDKSNQNQFVLSYELLYLLQWLVEYESETLKKMISRAVKVGFKDNNEMSHDVVELQVSDSIQQSIVDFLGLLDSLLIEVQHEHNIKKILQQNLVPALKQLDSTVCDSATVESSLEKTSSKIEHSPEQAQEILFKEILKRWKPHKKSLN